MSPVLQKVGNKSYFLLLFPTFFETINNTPVI